MLDFPLSLIVSLFREVSARGDKQGYTRKNIELLIRSMGTPERMPGLDLLARHAGRNWALLGGDDRRTLIPYLVREKGRGRSRSTGPWMNV